eukprot:gnl/TRDRNA2_/TRDRNA2_162683_c3_seq1.p1 gnl/TRDRNA2_/TRDRNA2_162683_c3~~gnl/TRDRNA2_/TRDRNA2_162683_c3_seq1.p1  ORF type:complete len:153 (-),score=18.30 gnl/TRDRNA2_/TRDRNA2_162683_c3_seq1:114-572(-)
MLGMWDPENPDQTVCAVAPLPEDLQHCLRSNLSKERATDVELRKYQVGAASLLRVEAFCQKYMIGPQEKLELQQGSSPCWFWRYRPKSRKTLLYAFEAHNSRGLQSLSLAGDYSFLFEGIRRHVADFVASRCQGIQRAVTVTRVSKRPNECT